MSWKPWFGRNAGGGWWVPVTVEGYLILGGFIAAILATYWLPVGYRLWALKGLGLAYLAGSFWLSRPG